MRLFFILLFRQSLVYVCTYLIPPPLVSRQHYLYIHNWLAIHFSRFFIFCWSPGGGGGCYNPDTPGL